MRAIVYSNATSLGKVTLTGDSSTSTTLTSRLETSIHIHHGSPKAHPSYIHPAGPAHQPSS